MDPKLLAEIESLGAVATCDGLLHVALPTPTLPPATTTNHLIVGHKRALLVDPATPSTRGQQVLFDLVTRLQAQGWRFEALLLTHHHQDHVGAAPALARRLGLPVWAHAATADLLEGQVEVHLRLADGAVVAEDQDGAPWRALHTPGHAAGHLVLHNQVHGGMIAGDMVAGQGTIVVDPDGGSMAEYLQSLARMADASPSFLAPAHGPVLREGAALLQHYIAHRRQREALVLEALTARWTAPHDLLPTAYRDVSRLAWPLALRSLLAHLIHLQQQGLASVRRGKWRRGF